MPRLRSKAVFLDRDGTIVEERGHIGRIDQVQFIRGAFTALRQLRKLGFKLVVISNQSGVARGIITLPQVERVNQYISSKLKKKNLFFDGLYYCPHHPKAGNGKFRKKCTCRKPSAGLVRLAQKKHNLSTRGNYVIGDKLTDVELAKNIGAKGVLVLTGFGREQLNRADDDSSKPDYIAKNILDAARWIIKLEQLT